MTVFVAATLSSGPAEIGRTMSQAAASGLSAAFTSAAVTAPAAFAEAASSTRSSLRPDCDTARKSWPLSVRLRRYTVAMLGAAAATGMPRVRSMRCLPKVAACAELPLAQVTTTCGRWRRRCRTSSASGARRLSAWRATASGASRISAAMRLPGSFAAMDYQPCPHRFCYGFRQDSGTALRIGV